MDLSYQDFTVDNDTEQSVQRGISSAWNKLLTGDKLGAVTLFREVVTLSSKDYKDNRFKLAQVCYEAGIGFFIAGPEYADEAATVLTQALQNFAFANGVQSIECARVHRRLGAIYASRGMFQESINSLRRSLDIFEFSETSSNNSTLSPKEHLRQRQLVTRMEAFANARAMKHTSETMAISPQSYSGTLHG